MANLSPLRQRLRRRAERAHAASVAETVKALRLAAPKETGDLSRAIRATSTRATPTRFTAVVEVPRGIERDKATWTEEGTRPHVIRARRAKALRFRAGGRIRFARVVHHPGSPARPWFHPTLARWPAGLRRSFRSTP